MQPDISIPKPIVIATYTALLTQTGTDAPTAIVLHNTIGDITFEYVDVGWYKAYLLNGFPEQYTTYTIQKMGVSEFYAAWNNTSEINIFTDTNAVSTGANNLLFETPFTIQVYNPKTTIQNTQPPPYPPNYKIYTALLTQSGTNAPTVKILQNTLGADITWTRVGTGHYLGTCTGKLISQQTTYFIQNNYSYDSIYILAEQTPPNSCYIEVAYLNAGVPTLTDDQLDDTPIEIKVYSS